MPRGEKPGPVDEARFDDTPPAGPDAPLGADLATHSPSGPSPGCLGMRGDWQAQFEGKRWITLWRSTRPGGMMAYVDFLPLIACQARQPGTQVEAALRPTSRGPVNFRTTYP